MLKSMEILIFRNTGPYPPATDDFFHGGKRDSREITTSRYHDISPRRNVPRGPIYQYGLF